MRIEDELTRLMEELTDTEAAELLAGFSGPVDPAAEARIRERVTERAFPQQQIQVSRKPRRIFYTVAAACMIVCLSVAAAMFLSNRPQRPPVAPGGSETVTETTAEKDSAGSVSGEPMHTDTGNTSDGAQTQTGLQTDTAGKTDTAVTAQTAPTEESRTETVSATAEPPHTDGPAVSGIIATTLTTQTTSLTRTTQTTASTAPERAEGSATKPTSITVKTETNNPPPKTEDGSNNEKHQDEGNTGNSDAPAVDEPVEGGVPQTDVRWTVPPPCGAEDPVETTTTETELPPV